MPPAIDPRLRRAVDASIGWYEDILALHGIGSRLADGVWASVGAPPPLHSDVVTVELDASRAAVERELAGRARWGFKDSFATIEPMGGELLFAASWIHRPPVERSVAPGIWRAIETRADLASWNERSGTAGVLLPGILARAHLRVMTRVVDGEVTAGAVARLGSGVVDISNVHGVSGHAVDWSELVDALGSAFPGRELVGYERGEDLEAALEAGFQRVGELRVWTGGG